MNATVLLGAALAGAAYTLTPGPAFLALLGIGAGQGRGAGAGFLCGLFIGDVLWATLALFAIVGASIIGTLVFDLLGLACGIYLFWIGLRAVRTRRETAREGLPRVKRPLLRGVAFGLTNPKAYPVALAMFTALLAGNGASLSWSSLPLLLTAALFGVIVADLVLVAVVGAAGVRRLYLANEVWITRAAGLMFIGFAVNAIMHAAPGLLARRA